jgi:hypothetical protein
MASVRCFVVILLLTGSVLAAPRQRSVILGKWHTVRASADAGEGGQIRIRKLLVNDRVVEYTFGPSHDVTDRLFVIRRAYRINDTLPKEEPQTPQWIWRVDGWISVDRVTGHVASLNLPAFDAEVSLASWYRDYVAYCGTSEDGAKAYLVVAQLGKRKPVLRKEFSGQGCASPQWERRPSRVTFMAAGEKSSFAVHSHGADPQPDTGEEEGPQ